jgi:hypothetical protein
MCRNHTQHCTYSHPQTSEPDTSDLVPLSPDRTLNECIGLLASLDFRFQLPVSLELMTVRRHCVDCDFAGLVAATRVSFPLTNTFMELSLSPDSSVYS